MSIAHGWNKNKARTEFFFWVWDSPKENTCKTKTVNIIASDNYSKFQIGGK